MAAPPLTLAKFKGYNSSATLAQMEADEFPVFVNLRCWDSGRKAIQRRGQTQTVAFALDSELQGLSWQKINANEYLLAVVSGSVYDAYTGSQLAGGFNRFPGGAEVNACWLNFQIILGDGVNPNVVAALSGSTLTCSQMTVQPCDASGLGLALGTAGLPNSTSYQYAVKFVSATGYESDVKAYSGTIGPVNQKVLLTSIPLAPAGQDCRARNVYRSKDAGAAATFFLLTTLADNVTTSYTDNTSDANLGLPMLNVGFQNSPFPPCRYLLATMQRLYGGGCFAVTGAVTGQVNCLYVSDVLDPTTARIASDFTTVYQGGRFFLETPGAGQITALGAYGSLVVPFTGGSQFLFSGTQPSNFTLSNFSTHGCVAHRTLLSSQEYLVWLGPDGVYAWKAGAFADAAIATVYAQRSYLRISDRVRERIDAMPASGMAAASAVFSDNRYWLSWPQGNLVYDFLFDSWYEDTGNNWRQLAASIFTSANRQRVYGSLLGHGQVWQLDTGSLDGTGAIHCHLQTKDLDAGLPGHNKRVAWAGGLFRATSENLSGSLIRNSGQTIQNWLIPLSSGSVAQVVPANNNVSRMRQRVPESALSEFHRLDFQCDSTHGQFEILSVQLEWVEPTDAGGTNG